MAMRSALGELRKHFEDTDRTAGEVVVRAVGSDP